MQNQQRPTNGNKRYTALAFAFCAIAWAVIVGKAVFFDAPPREVVASDAELTDFAKKTLDEIQPRSFAENREFCGLIFEDDDGALSASEIHEGSESECSFSWASPMGQHPIATFHTHGSFNDDYDGEAPSLLDLQTDIGDQIDGFVATPGGRVWHVDWQDETATQVCGLSCIAQDPKYKPCYSFQPVEKYNVAELMARGESDVGECL
ncbi:MAG: DUF4329 domain-containing protein [Marinomonas sp.]